MEESKIPAEMIADQLQHLRTQFGEDAYNKALHGIALKLILEPGGEEFIKKAAPDLDLESVRREAQARREEEKAQKGAAFTPGSPEDALFGMLQAQMPAIKSQAHLTTFMAAFDALRTVLDGYFSGNRVKAEQARLALNKALDMAGQIQEVTEKVAEIPEEERSERLRDYVEPPKQFHEYDTQRRLLAELDGLQDMEKLTAWYAASKDAMDRVVSASLRNALFDAIRTKKNALSV